MNKYILLKGCEGFADRLECLLQAMAYSSTLSRVLVVDWRDDDWAHEESLGFDSYFELRDIPYLPLENFLAMYSRDSSQLTVVPKAWKEVLANPSNTQLLRDSAYGFGSYRNKLSNPFEKIRIGHCHDFKEDIVVYPGYGDRYYHARLMQKLQLKQAAKAKIQEAMDQLKITDRKYDVIHLRGGSKKWMGGDIRSDSPVKELHERWNDATQYIEDIWEAYRGLLSTYGNQPLVLISDTPRLAEYWIERYRCGTYIQGSAGHYLEKCGIHKLTKENLSRCGTTKHDLNIECIRDFALMVGSRFIVGDGVSRYSLLALHAKEAGVSFVPQ